LGALAPFSPETAAIPAAEASSGVANLTYASGDIATEQALVSMIIERFNIMFVARSFNSLVLGSARFSLQDV
jgi:hypothetical protein